jgi:hypothetical protein
MALLRRGVDLTVIALWLGHESVETTMIYMHADMQLKERALSHASEFGAIPKRFRPPPTASLHSWSPSNYADRPRNQNPKSQGTRATVGQQLGIIRKAALLLRTSAEKSNTP